MSTDNAEFYLKRVKEQIDYIEEVKKRDCTVERKREVLDSAKGVLLNMYKQLGNKVIEIASKI